MLMGDSHGLSFDEAGRSMHDSRLSFVCNRPRMTRIRRISTDFNSYFIVVQNYRMELLKRNQTTIYP